MSMTDPRPPRFLTNWRKRTEGPKFINRDQDVIRNVARDIAMRHPHHTAPKPFTEQLREFGEGADQLMKRLAETTEELRTVLAENAVLRARNEDLEQHIGDQDSHWAQQYEMVNSERQRLTRLYYSLISRFDGAVEFLTNARESAKREAFAPDETQEPQRPDLNRAHPRTDDAAAAIEQALRRPGVGRLPPADYGDGSHGNPPRRDIDTGRREFED